MLKHFVMLSALITSPHSWGNTIDVATFDWCPYICLGDQKKPGILVDYLHTIYADTKFKIKLQGVPWTRAIKLVESGQMHALLAPAKEEAPKLIFPNSPIGLQRFCLFSRSKDPWHYTGANSLKHRRLLYPQDALPDEIKHVVLNNNKSLKKAYDEHFLSKATTLLTDHRIDSVLMTKLSMMYFIKQHQLGQSIKLSGCVSSQAIYVAFTPNKTHQNVVKALINSYEKHIAKLQSKNYFEQLVKSYTE